MRPGGFFASFLGRPRKLVARGGELPASASANHKPSPKLMHWQTHHFSELSAQNLYDALRLRSEVFVVEQNCVFLDPDKRDAEAFHLLGRTEQGALHAYCRLLSGPKISRVVTAPEARGTGLGRVLMNKALEECARLWPASTVTINAQAHLQGFYASLGFVVTSDIYDEDGIPHIDMKR
ncbi:MAG TPA: GNAT family N-acetyltransferase [Burkholderiaceae bacterium]